MWTQVRLTLVYSIKRLAWLHGISCWKTQCFTVSNSSIKEHCTTASEVITLYWDWNVPIICCYCYYAASLRCWCSLRGVNTLYRRAMRTRDKSALKSLVEVLWTVSSLARQQMRHAEALDLDLRKRRPPTADIPASKFARRRLGPQSITCRAVIAWSPTAEYRPLWTRPCLNRGSNPPRTPRRPSPAHTPQGPYRIVFN